MKQQGIWYITYDTRYKSADCGSTGKDSENGRMEEGGEGGRGRGIVMVDDYTP